MAGGMWRRRIKKGEVNLSCIAGSAIKTAGPEVPVGASSVRTKPGEDASMYYQKPSPSTTQSAAQGLTTLRRLN